MKITSKDVAREAGVSQTTVSLVLNGRNLDSFSPETQQNVWSVAKRLGYIPSTAAKALRLGRNDIIICLIPDLPSTTAIDEFKTLLSGYLSKAGLVCVFFHYAEMADELEALWGRIRPALVIALIELANKDFLTLKNARIPCINGIFHRKSDGYSESGLDQFSIGELQARHLISRGYESLIYVGVDDPREALFCRARGEGVKITCERQGIPFKYCTIAGYRKENAQNVVAHLLPTTVRQGIAAFNDMTAITIMSVLNTLSLRIPEQVGLIGVDNLPVAQLIQPEITSVELSLSVNAAYLSRKILTMLEMPSDVLEDNFPPVDKAIEIVQRETT